MMANVVGVTSAAPKPWTARLPMTRNPEPIYEYACHEGNYALPHALEGERNIERAAAEAAKKGSN